MGYAPMLVHARTRAHTCIRMHTHTHAHLLTHTKTYTHTYTRTHASTHAHTPNVHVPTPSTRLCPTPKSRTARAQDDDDSDAITRPPFAIQDRLNEAAVRISEIFRQEEEFGGSDQVLCVCVCVCVCAGARSAWRPQEACTAQKAAAVRTCTPADAAGPSKRARVPAAMTARGMRLLPRIVPSLRPARHPPIVPSLRPARHPRSPMRLTATPVAPMRAFVATLPLQGRGRWTLKTARPNTHLHTHIRTHACTHTHTQTHALRSPASSSLPPQFCVQTRGMVSTLVVVQDSIRRSKRTAEEGGRAHIPREGNRIIIGNPAKMNAVRMEGGWRACGQACLAPAAVWGGKGQE